LFGVKSFGLKSLFPAVRTSFAIQRLYSEQAPRLHIERSPSRTHYCGELRKTNLDQSVSLCGWVLRPRKINDELIFLPLRDRTGVIQLVFNNQGKNQKEIFEKIEKLNVESVIHVQGKVKMRPQEMHNPKIETGEIEVDIQDLNMLNQAAPLPFSLNEKVAAANEPLRLKHRYLDLRRVGLLKNIELRSHVTSLTRNYFLENRFLEVETPTLFKHTPEGAREYIVPTRNKGKFYALVQSPQQYKQLLMAGGIDRYFQVARCYRDEDLRADRQPEFTQVFFPFSFTLFHFFVELLSFSFFFFSC